jgi:hypothetical protein
VDTSHLRLIWADKPGCPRPIAEIWIGESELWFTVFVDDDNALKIEIFTSKLERNNIFLAELERLIELAKHDLLNWRPPSLNSSS